MADPVTEVVRACSGAKNTSRQQVQSFSYAEALLVKEKGAAQVGVAMTVCDWSRVLTTSKGVTN